ncbi:TFIIB-type zinc ribbon-containing protein, partial [Halobaculum lipolyticum]
MSESETTISSYTEREKQAKERPAERERAEETESVSVCPECGGSVVADEEHGESVCTDCGLVVEEGAIDRGPEWRSFNRDGESKSRVGAPTTKMMHDKGLSTNIGWQNKDA